MSTAVAQRRLTVEEYLAFDAELSMDALYALVDTDASPTEADETDADA